MKVEYPDVFPGCRECPVIKEELSRLGDPETVVDKHTLFVCWASIPGKRVLGGRAEIIHLVDETKGDLSSRTVNIEPQIVDCYEEQKR